MSKINWTHLPGSPRTDWYAEEGHSIQRVGPNDYLLVFCREELAKPAPADYPNFTTALAAKEYAEQFA